MSIVALIAKWWLVTLALSVAFLLTATAIYAMFAEKPPTEKEMDELRKRAARLNGDRP